MASPQPPPKQGWTGPRAALLVAGLLVAIAIILLVKGLPRDGAPDEAPAPARIDEANDPGAAAFVAGFERSPTFRHLLAPIKQANPAEYRAFLSDLMERTDRGDPATAGRLSLEFGRGLIRSRLDAISGAPPADLRRIAEAHAALGRALKDANAGQCAEYVRSGTVPAAALGPALLPHLGRALRAELAAERAARAAPGQPRLRFRQEDADAFVARLGAAHPAELALFTDQATFLAAPAAGQCAAGVATWDAALALPGEQGAHIAAHLLRSSLGVPSEPR